MFRLTQPLTLGQPVYNTSFHYSIAVSCGIPTSAHWDFSKLTWICSAIHSTMTSRLFYHPTWPNLPCSCPSMLAHPGHLRGAPMAAGTLVPPGPRSILHHPVRLQAVYPAKHGWLPLPMDS